MTSSSVSPASYEYSLCFNNYTDLECLIDGVICSRELIEAGKMDDKEWQPSGISVYNVVSCTGEVLTSDT